MTKPLPSLLPQEPAQPAKATQRSTRDDQPEALGWTGGQYSILRAGIGLLLVVHLVAIVGADPFSQTLGWPLLCLAGVPFAVLLVVGALDTAAAVMLLLVLIGLAWMNPLAGGWVAACSAPFLLTHTLMPRAPYGSAEAVGRTDPAGDWSPNGRPRLVLLRSMPWLLITALLIWWVGVVEQLATPSPWRDGFMFLSGIGWGALAILYRAAPRVPPAYPDRIDWLFYDGYCGLCHGAVRTVLAEDRLTRKRKQGAFKLCPQQAPAFERQLNEKTRSSLPDSVIVLTKKGDLITRSEATRYIFLRLGGIWRLIGHFLWLVPRPLRDAAYGLIARWRYRLFGKAEQVCPMMPPRYRKRFVLD